MSNKLYDQLKEERSKVAAQIESIFDGAAKENRDFSEAEDANLKDLNDQIRKLDARIEQVTDHLARENRAAEVASKVGEGREVNIKVGSEPLTYGKENRNHSYFVDLYRAKSMGDADAQERLNRHQAEMKAEYRAVATGDLNGFVPPKYLTEDFAELRKYGRPVANYIGSRPKTAKDMIIPRVTQGGTIGFQSAENAPLDAQDWTTEDITAAGKTLGGYVDFSVQALEYGMGGVTDSEIYGDLLRSYNEQVESFVLANNVTNAWGVLEVAGTNQVISTDAASYANFLAAVAKAKRDVYVNYKGAPEAIVVDPTVFAWLESQESQNSPVFKAAQGSLAANQAQGPVGTAFGMDVIVSHGMPSDYADSATPSDRPVIVGALSTCRLWESGTQTNQFTDILSASAGVRFRLIGHVAFTAQRHPNSISIIGGDVTTGLLA